VKGSESSSRVRVLVPEEDAVEAFRFLRISRMMESGLSLFLKGRISSVGSVRRRFLLSAMDGCRRCECGRESDSGMVFLFEGFWSW